MPVFMIAEAGVNHNGDVLLAKELIDVAAAAGANAVKFQTYTTDKLVSAGAPKAEYQKRNAGEDESQAAMLRRLELKRSDYQELMSHCFERGIVFLSTPFDEDAVDFLDGLGVPAFKLGSGDLTNLPLLEHVARKGKPVILSTGMSDLEEVRDAVKVMEELGCGSLILLQCVSNYPADASDVNLRAMSTMANEFSLPVGYSDHTEGIEVALAAAALGACIIEKHFTLNKTLPGPDHRASLEPSELTAMIEGIRKVEAALGTGEKTRAASEENTAQVARRSLTAARDISAGTQLTRDMIAIQRPGTGLTPGQISSVIGRRLRIDVKTGSQLFFDMLDDENKG
jgi:N,N'-diacetyllegionaminate synthase